MNRIVKIKKLLISIFVILIFAIICSSSVKGATITKKDGTTYEVEDEYKIFSDDPEVNKSFDTFYGTYAGAGNALLFCINHSAGYFGTLSKAEYETYQPDGTLYFEYCVLDGNSKAMGIKQEAGVDEKGEKILEVLNGEGTYMIYTFKEKVNDKMYQDAMHIFYEAMHKTTTVEKDEGKYLAPVIKDVNNDVIVSAKDFSKAIWSTYLNIGKKENPNKIAEEGKKFKEFYKYIHGIPLYDSNDPEIHKILGYNPNDQNYPEGQNPDHQEIYESKLNYDSYSDIFANLIKNNTDVDNIIVEVNQAEAYYIVGPFNITYPDGYVDSIKKNKFSWINSIQAVTEHEDGTEKTYTPEILVLNENGEKVNLSENSSDLTEITRIQKDGDYKLNGQDFYIKFYSTSAINLKLKVDFGYIESYDGEVVTYDGKSRGRDWNEVTVKDDNGNDVNCVEYLHNGEPKHGYEHPDGHGYEHPNGCPYGTVPMHPDGDVVDGNRVQCTHMECECKIECDHVKTSEVKGYEIIDEDKKIVTQRMAHVVSVESNIKGSTIVIGIPDDGEEKDEFDLTMKIAGNVFLDAAGGKANDVNNLFDNGEGLLGITVILHNADGSFAYKDGKLLSTITDKNGYYEFDGLNAQNKYYVEYLYNGMLYTNVNCISSIEENFPNRSKATETSQSHGNNRTNFNKIFQEIGSYPSNYYSPSGNFWNRTYSQDEIADVFIRLERLILENKAATKEEVFDQLKNEFDKNKAAFAIDCMISAYSEKTYPTVEHFKIQEIIDNEDPNALPPLVYLEDYSPFVVPYPESGGGITTNGKYNQLHVNLGIKARPTIDLQLMKSVSEIEVRINGKNENYKYDPTTLALAPSVGVIEEDYLNGMVGKYKGGEYTIPEKEELFPENTLEFNMRTEEIINGNAIGHDGNSYTGYENENYLNKDKEEKDKLIKGKDNKYAVANNGKELKDDRLKIFITYRLDITNTSTVPGAVTEIVDYYDPNLKVVDAYIGNSSGAREGNVNIANTSRYGTNTEYKNDNAYKTMYLVPDETWLDFSQVQYIYVKFELIGKDNDVGQLLANALKDNNDKLISMNVAEINGYETNEGVIDIDSTPGNLDIREIDKLQYSGDKDKKYLKDFTYEDDTSKAPAIVFKLTVSRSIEGTVFEDSSIQHGYDGNAVKTGQQRTGDGIFDKDKEKRIAGVKVELIEIKNGEMIPRAKTYTNANGWYGFTGFIPGDYTIKYTYGEEDYTAMTTKSQYYKGANDTSYNGQDYQSTIYRYNTYITTSPINIGETIIDNFPVSGSYWYDRDTTRYSDARDDEERVKKVKAYSKEEDGVEITNHKAEVFSAYVDAEQQQTHITKEYYDALKLNEELEQKTHRYAYTPLMEIEVEYAKTTWESGTHGTEHRIQNVDFGIIQRPKEELLIDQDVVHVKITSAKGETLIDTDTKVENFQWVKGEASNEKDWRGEFSDWAKELLKGTKLSEYEKEELVNAIVDEEVINGAQLEIEYNIQVRNNAELGNGNTRAKRIVNYVSNNLTFDEENNRDSAGRPLWKVVPRESIQNGEKSTLINNTGVDLSTQSVILEATDCNPLIGYKEGKTVKESLPPNGQTETVKLVLKKVLSTEGGSTGEDFIFTNMTEIVEIENDEGRYDHGAIPGNQDLTLQPQEHDTSGASRYADHGDTLHPQDGTVVVGPPYGSNYNYYTYLIIGITLAGVILVGVILIKKFVINKQ